MWELITQGLRAFAETIGLINKRTDLKNAPDVKAAAIATDEQKQIDKINKDVANGDLDAMRKDIAE